MVAVIAFVALQFGWISKPGEKKDDSQKESSQEGRPPANDVIGNLMGSLMKQMGPVLERSMAQNATSSEEQAVKPVLAFE